MLRVASGHFSHSDTGRQRRANEDSFFARSPVFVVADGMGGAQAGEVASRVAVEAFEGNNLVLVDEGHRGMSTPNLFPTSPRRGSRTARMP